MFQQFLHWLDEGRDSGGTRYLEMRRRLAGYFDRKNCEHCDDLADETLTRVMRRIQEDGSIRETPPARYCYINLMPQQIYIVDEMERIATRDEVSCDEELTVAEGIGAHGG